MTDEMFSGSLAYKFADISLGVEESIRAISTPYGIFKVVVQGDNSKPALLTLHDVGLSSETNFKPFFNIPEMRNLVNSFHVFHVNIPGQEDDSTTKSCPDMKSIDLALDVILTECQVTYFAGIGYGAGAYALSMFALRRPDAVSSLILFNAASDSPSWTDSTSLNMHAFTLRRWGLGNSVLNYLRWYHCGCVNEYTNQDLIQSYDDRFSKLNNENLANWMNVYAQRPTLGLMRPVSGSASAVNFKCPILLIVGTLSPHLEQTRTLFTLCDPEQATLLEISDCRAPLDENPLKVMESISYHLQGAGYSLNQFRKTFQTFGKVTYDSGEALTV